MSCLITKGRLEPCKDKVSGLYKLWFANFGTLTGLTVSLTDDSISGATDASLFEYELKGQNTFVQNLVSSVDNGVTMVTQNLTINLKGLDASTSHEIKLLAYSRPHIFIQDNNGNMWLMAKDFGASINADANIGANLGDPYAYTLTIVATEKAFANSVSSATLTNPFGGIGQSGTIVKGS